MKHIFIDAARCTGCKSCELACAVEHSKSKDLFEAIYESPIPPRFNTVIQFDDFNASLRCVHCEDAPCVSVCPTGSLSRNAETNLVVYDTSKCIGCWQCAMTCPFGAIYPAHVADLERMVATKCDGCYQRVGSGRIPACVEACPTNALVYTEPVELEKYKKENLMKSIVKGSEIIALASEVK